MPTCVHANGLTQAEMGVEREREPSSSKQWRRGPLTAQDWEQGVIPPCVSVSGVCTQDDVVTTVGSCSWLTPVRC